MLFVNWGDYSNRWFAFLLCSDMRAGVNEPTRLAFFVALLLPFFFLFCSALIGIRTIDPPLPNQDILIELACPLLFLFSPRLWLVSSL